MLSMWARSDTDDEASGEAGGDGDVLVRWLEAVPRGSAAGSGARPVDAFADVVASALADPGRARAALRRFGRRLAVEGWALGELAGAVERLAVLEPRLAGELGTFAAGVALAEGWVDGARLAGGDRACRDPLTGLLTTGVLRIRLDQVYDEGQATGRDPRRLYRLVVVDARAPLDQSPFVRDASLLVLAQQLRTTFAAGETVCATGGGRMVVLAANDDGLAARTEALVRALRRTPLLARVPVRARLEALPSERAALPAFLARLLD